MFYCDYTLNCSSSESTISYAEVFDNKILPEDYFMDSIEDFSWTAPADAMVIDGKLTWSASRPFNIINADKLNLNINQPNLFLWF